LSFLVRDDEEVESLADFVDEDVTSGFEFSQIDASPDLQLLYCIIRV